MSTLSKSKLVAWRQCPKRLWLEVYQPELCCDSSAAQPSFSQGHAVGALVQQLYDPEGRGEVLNLHTLGWDAMFARTQQLLQQRVPIFEAALRTDGALVLADILLPVGDSGWRMVEVKSSTHIKDYHLDDIAIQSYVARAAGVQLEGVALAHVNNQFVYAGDGDYSGLLVEEDYTEEALARHQEVQRWVSQAQAVLGAEQAPNTAPGAQCNKPFVCGFYAHCTQGMEQAEHPVQWLPYYTGRVRKEAEARGIRDMAQLQDSWLSPLQQRVRQATLSNTVFFDQAGAQQALQDYGYPAYFLDFESMGLAVPRWAGTRPYQHLVFQYSLHVVDAAGQVHHHAHLDLSGDDPTLGIAQSLVEHCGDSGPIFVYNAQFERQCLGQLAQRHPQLAQPLQRLIARVVDLLPMVREYYYHPSQHGSWSIKAVLPAACPDLSYADLDGVQDGGGAQAAYWEAIQPDTSQARREALRRQLLAYCALDTWAMVRLWGVLRGIDCAILISVKHHFNSPYVHRLPRQILRP